MLPKNPLAPPVARNAIAPSAMQSIVERERVSDWYWTRKDALIEMRIWWRTTTARHILHILPGETILELGCGSGMLTRALAGVTRGECPITAATFDPKNDVSRFSSSLQSTDGVRLTEFPGELAGREFDYVIASNVLDHTCSAPLLTEVQKLLKPGGRLLFFETNPWNPVFQLRRQLSRVLPFLARGDERLMHNRVQLYELLSELGYVGIAAMYYDFLYPPVPRWSLPVTRPLSLVMENTPGLKLMAGTILLNAQKPPRGLPRPSVRMTEHRGLHGAISVVVPCYNEEMNLRPLVEGLLKHYDKYIHEIVLVDDNSKDRSREIMRELAAHEPRVRPLFREPPRTPEMGSSSFSLLKNGIGYAKILASLAWRSRFGARPLPRQPEPQASPSGVSAL
jgi:dolichol-phosphate mannosyltransferase